MTWEVIADTLEGMFRGAGLFCAAFALVTVGCGSSDDSGGSASGGASGSGGSGGSGGGVGGSGGSGGVGGSGGTSGSGGTGGAGGTVTVKRVFVTSTELEPDFGSAVDADATCQGVADSASLGGTWMAWLSDDTSSPSQRFTPASIPYALLDGTEIATSFATLISGQLSAPVNRDENDTPVATDVFAWTGTEPDGTASLDNCMNWTVAIAATGIRGATDATGATWTDAGVSGCFFPQRLYCFEQ